MTVKELIESLKQLDQDQPIYTIDEYGAEEIEFVGKYGSSFGLKNKNDADDVFGYYVVR